MDVWSARFMFGVATIASLYFCRPRFCGDSVSVYSGTPGYGRLRRKICYRQTSSTAVLSYSRTAYVSFQSDTFKGTGTGFRGCFKAEGTFCAIYTYTHTYICDFPTCKDLLRVI